MVNINIAILMSSLSLKLSELVVVIVGSNLFEAGNCGKVTGGIRGLAY